MKLLTLSGSPHIHGALSVEKVMWAVSDSYGNCNACILLLFWLGAILVTSVAVISAVVFEYLITKFILKEKSQLGDGSAVITGILLAFNVPSSLPLWMIVLGALIAIGVAKMSFGGLGKNPFNPALVGRVFCLYLFPAQMTSWPVVGKLFPMDWMPYLVLLLWDW